MHLRLGLLGPCQVLAIKSTLCIGHVVTHNLEQYSELSNNGFVSLAILAPEERQLASDTDAVHICELAH